MTAPKKTETNPMTQPAPEGTTADVTAAVVKPAVVSPDEAFEMTKAPTPVNPPIAIGVPGEMTPDQRKAALKRADADGLAGDAMIQALEAEREGYLRSGNKARAAEVDADIKARQEKARQAAPKGRTARQGETA